MKGTEAIAEAAIQAGCKYFFGYPITPQNEIPEYMSAKLPKIGGAYVQAESEVAAINMAVSYTHLDVYKRQGLRRRGSWPGCSCTR